MTLPAYYAHQGLCNGRVSVRLMSVPLIDTCRLPQPVRATDEGSVMLRAEGRSSKPTCFICCSKITFLRSYQRDRGTSAAARCKATTISWNDKEVTRRETDKMPSRVYIARSIALSTSRANAVHSLLASDKRRTCTNTVIIPAAAKRPPSAVEQQEAKYRPIPASQ